jgi:hypothetical protein
MKVRVPVIGGNLKAINIESGATAGATFGVNLYDSSGGVLTIPELKLLLGIGPTTISSTISPTSAESIVGTAGQIDAVTAGANVTTISIDPAYVGQTSITTLGTIATGVWAGTAVAIAHGGTGQTTAAAAFAALSPMTTEGDMIYETAAPAPGRLPLGASTYMLFSNGSVPVWQAQTNITQLGTVTVGVWEGTPVAVAYGGVPSTSGITSGWVLTNSSGTPAWAAGGGGGSTDAYPQELAYAGIF